MIIGKTMFLERVVRFVHIVDDLALADFEADFIIA